MRVQKVVFTICVLHFCVSHASYHVLLAASRSKSRVYYVFLHLLYLSMTTRNTTIKRRIKTTTTSSIVFLVSSSVEPQSCLRKAAADRRRAAERVGLTAERVGLACVARRNQGRSSGASYASLSVAANSAASRTTSPVPSHCLSEV